MTIQQDERAELIRKLNSIAAQQEKCPYPIFGSVAVMRQAAALLEADSGGWEAVSWRDGVNVARLRAALTRMGIATDPSEEGTAADLENWVNALTRAVTRPQQAAQVAQPLTEEQIAAAMTGQKETGVAFKHVIQIARAIEAAHGIGKDQG